MKLDIVNETDGIEPGDKLDKKNRYGNERDASFIASQANMDGLWNISEFDCSTSDDSTNAKEGEVRDYEESYRHCSAERGLFEKDAKCELPEIIVCYKERHDSVVKDICVDQGLTSLGEGLRDFLVPPADEYCCKDSGNRRACVELVKTDVSRNGEKGERREIEDIVPELSGDTGNGVDKESVETLYEEGMSKNSTSVPAADWNPAPVSAEESNDPSAPVASCEEESSQNGDAENAVAPNMHKLEDITFSEQVRRSPAESSFSITCPLSGVITYSGPIAYSGSCSLRSDSSTTSTRSFAFPVLQAEWNSSPVRMRKADRRRHGGWMEGLLCCRF